MVRKLYQYLNFAIENANKEREKKASNLIIRNNFYEI